MQQKPPDLDDFGKPIKLIKPPDLDVNGKIVDEYNTQILDEALKKENESSIDKILTEAKKPLKTFGDTVVKRNDIKPIDEYDPEVGGIKGPTTFWGGFRKSLKDQFMEATVGNEMLQGAARPKSLSDFSNLLLPSGIPQISKFFGKGNKAGKLDEVASAVKEPTAKPPVESNIQFNRKGKTGETGSMQSSIEQPVIKSEPVLAQKIRIKQPTPELVKKAKEAGYGSPTVDDNGHIIMTLDPPTAPKVKQPILETEVGNTRPNKLGPDVDTRAEDIASEVMNFPRTVLASQDMSAPFRQGLGLIHKKEFWKALPSMVKSWGSEEFFQASQKLIAEKPLFKKRVGPALKDGSGYRELPSFAEDAGLKLTDLHNLKEEAFSSNLAQIIPGVRRSERAYVSFLNKLRADTFESLIQQGRELADVARKTGKDKSGFFSQSIAKENIADLDPMLNGSLAKELAEWVNVATGRGSLGKAERAAKILNSTFFSPRLIASRVQMLNPHYYITANPMVRKEALKSLLAITAFGNTVTTLGRMIPGSSVESDPASSDFGKLKVGNARLDPFGGFQQYIVAAQRLLPHLDPKNELFAAGPMSVLGQLQGYTEPHTDKFEGFGGRMKSTTTDRTYDLGQPKFGESSRMDVAERFARGKLNPVLGFAWSLLDKQRELSGKKMDLTNINPFENSVAQRFIPILIQDMYEIMTNEPQNAWMLGPAAFGMGNQQYEVKK